jgi:predicted membrane channel-forming protein YqfA (hemolysin III family)
MDRCRLWHHVRQYDPLPPPALCSASLPPSLCAVGADFDNPSTSTIELTAFVGMGGSVIFVWHNIMEALSASAIYLLVAGGAAYVTGIVFFIWGMSRPIYHSIWHLFVVLGLPPSLSFCT